MRLSISNATATKVISVTNVAPAKPYLNINGYYVPLTTATIAGTKVKIQSGTVTYRACEYQSGYYNTTSAAVGNLSSTTALTRVSTSGTTYLTRLSTSGTNYGTRASTSGTSYATRASTSGTTYLTRLSTSGTSYATRASTSGTTYLTRASTSATLLTSSSLSAFNASFYKVIKSLATYAKGASTMTSSQMYGRSTTTYGGSGAGYLVSEGRGTMDAPSARANYIKFKLTQNLNLGYQEFYINGTSTVACNSTYITSKAYTPFLTSAPQVNVHANGSVIYATSSNNLALPWIAATANCKYYTSLNGASTLGNFTGVSIGTSSSTTRGAGVTSMVSFTCYNVTNFFYQERLVPSYATRASTSGTSYGTRASTSATIYLTRLSTSGTNYGTRASTSATIYLTRASTSGTTYLTRLSTSGTNYGTRASTSAYSGKLSSSKWA